MPDPSSFDPSKLSEHAAQNRETWNEDSDWYQEANAAHLSGSQGAGWGVWQIPESELQVLGEVAGLDVLEFGCGAGQWSVALAKAGARVVGLDLSERQLEHARSLMEAENLEYPLVHASAEDVPLPDESFDVVMSDYGAMTFADPYVTVAEAARLLRPGGLLAFCGSTPIVEMCYPDEGDEPDEKLNGDYFGMWSIPYDDYVQYQLPYGAWIRLFRGHGFVVEDLIELRPKEDATSSFRNDAERDWYRRWPGEQIWKVRKES